MHGVYLWAMPGRGKPIKNLVKTGHSASTALLLIDVINPLDFPGSKQLAERIRPTVARIQALSARARRKNIPVIYVNDNFGQWRSDFRKILESCSQKRCPGHFLARALKPHRDDYLIVKPKLSGFYQTPLELLPNSLKVRRLVMLGFAFNLCVLFTAGDAHMRDYRLCIPPDCVAGFSRGEEQHTLVQLEKYFKARLLQSDHPSIFGRV